MVTRRGYAFFTFINNNDFIINKARLFNIIINYFALLLMLLL